MSGYNVCSDCKQFLCVCGLRMQSSGTDTSNIWEKHVVASPDMSDITRLLKDQDVLREQLKLAQGKIKLVEKLCRTVNTEIAPIIATKNDAYWVKLLETIAEILKDEQK